MQVFLSQLLLLLLLQALAEADRRALSAGVELSDLQRQLAEARGERDASQVRVALRHTGCPPHAAVGAVLWQPCVNDPAICAQVWIGLATEISTQQRHHAPLRFTALTRQCVSSVCRLKPPSCWRSWRSCEASLVTMQPCQQRMRASRVRRRALQGSPSLAVCPVEGTACMHQQPQCDQGALVSYWLGRTAALTRRAYVCTLS